MTHAPQGDASLLPPDHVITIFGADGNLARRELLPALWHLAKEGFMPADFRVVGVGLKDMTTEDFVEFAGRAVDAFSSTDLTSPQWEEFTAKMVYVGHKFEPGATDQVAEAVRSARSALSEDARLLFHLAVPPTMFVPITNAIGESGLAGDARAIYEKPYGSDAGSSRELNRSVHEVFHESQVFRIDHFLGQETVQNILVLRFANGMFEPVWDRNHIDHVQIQVLEEIDIETRAGFYEPMGALKDMLVTHLFQVLSIVAMEPPSSINSKALIAEKTKVFQAMLPLEPQDVVRGQYGGYRDTEGVSKESGTETFIACRLFIDNWRWAGIPFYLRTGKALKQTATRVTLAFKKPPRKMFDSMPQDGFGHDHLTLELGRNEGIAVSFLAKKPGPTISLGPARMEFHYDSFESELIGPYERLILDALMGDRTLFTSAEGVERAWEAVAKTLENPPELHEYERGSWGPPEADTLIEPHEWHLPTARPGTTENRRTRS